MYKMARQSVRGSGHVLKRPIKTPMLLLNDKCNNLFTPTILFYDL